MTYHIFSKRIDNETSKEFLDIINKNEGDITLALDSAGGEFQASLYLAHVLNTEISRITLIAVNAVYSGAFLIFYLFKGKKKISGSCRGMLHQSVMEVSISSSMEWTYNNSKVNKATLKHDHKQIMGIAKSIMTLKEYRNLKKKNRDIYFDFNRMKEIFPEAEII